MSPRAPGGQLLVVGLNHHVAPLALRERLAFPAEEIPALLSRLGTAAGLQEAMLVSTCNRVEVYGVAEQWSRSATAAVEELGRLRGIATADLEGHVFAQGRMAAARHIFRVTASLDSLVVGEPQVLGQVKDALEAARGAGTVGPVLDRCLGAAFHAAKRARTETDLGRGAASVASVAVDLARTIFGELEGRGVLLVGAGEMSEQAGVHLRAAGASEIVVVNRSPERGRALAQKVGGRYEEWSRLEPELRRVDVVISGTGAQLPVIGPDLMKSVMKARRHEPIFLVDIAVPRDVDPRVARMEHVFLYNVDDLQGIVHDNLRARAAEADRATAIVDAELEEFARWQRTRAVGPLIGRLQGRGEEIAAAEARKALGRLPGLAPEQRQIVEQLARAVARKLVHAPVTQLRAASAGDDPADAGVVEAFERIFALEGPAEVEAPDGVEAAEEPAG